MCVDVLWHCRAGLLKSGLVQTSHDVALLNETATNACGFLNIDAFDPRSLNYTRASTTDAIDHSCHHRLFKLRSQAKFGF